MMSALSVIMLRTIALWSPRIVLKFHYYLQMFCSSPQKTQSTTHTCGTILIQIERLLYKEQDQDLILQCVQDHLKSSTLSLSCCVDAWKGNNPLFNRGIECMEE
jgi:hypothetical protein